MSNELTVPNASALVPQAGFDTIPATVAGGEGTPWARNPRPKP